MQYFEVLIDLLLSVRCCIVGFVVRSVWMYRHVFRPSETVYPVTQHHIPEDSYHI